MIQESAALIVLYVALVIFRGAARLERTALFQSRKCRTIRSIAAWRRPAFADRR
jgi:hypothetical protein